MFYEEDEINDLLKCSRCKSKFSETIKNLPCGNAICVDCVREIELEIDHLNDEFKCKSCQQTHKMPKDGLPNNMPLMKLMLKQPKEIYRSEKVDSLKELIGDMNSSNEELKHRLKNATDEARDYCDSLRQEVDLMTESAIDYLNKLNQQLLKQIDVYEKDLVKSLEEEKNGAFNSKKDESNNMAKQVDEFGETWTRYLKKLQIDYKEIDAALDKGNSLKNSLEQLKLDLKKNIFKNRLLKFHENRTFFETSEILGSLVMSSFNRNLVLEDDIQVLNTMYAMPYSDNIGLLNQQTLAFGCKDDYSIKLMSINDGSIQKSLVGHTLDIDSILILPNNQLASSSWDMSIKIWNTNTGRLLRTLTGHTDKVYSLVQLQNGHLASCSHDMTIRVWNYREGSMIRMITDYNWIFVMVVLENGDLASGGGDTPIKIWNPYDGALKKILSGHYNFVLSLVVLPNEMLASGSRDTTIRIWSTADGLIKHTLISHTDEVLSLFWLPSGHLVSACKDKTIKIWNSNKEWDLERTLTEHTDTVMSLAYLQSGILISGSYDGTFKLWKLFKD